MASNALLFVIVGKNEPLYEYNKVQAADSVTRQNYFVLHSALDLVEKAAYTTNNMYLRVVDKVRGRVAWRLGARRWAVHLARLLVNPEGNIATKCDAQKFRPLYHMRTASADISIVFQMKSFLTFFSIPCNTSQMNRSIINKYQPSLLPVTSNSCSFMVERAKIALKTFSMMYTSCT